jgi:hypothetical protein
VELPPGTAFKCDECTLGAHTCFLCKKKTTSAVTKKCSSTGCGKYYHDECVRSSGLFRKEHGGQFFCSHHACATCICEAALGRGDSSHHAARDSLVAQASKGRLVKCVRCPTAYHAGDHCLAAGSIILNSNYIVCPRHFVPLKSKYYKLFFKILHSMQ